MNDIVEFYYFNSKIQQTDYKQRIKQMLKQLLKLAIKYSFDYTHDYEMRKEQYERYMAHIDWDVSDKDIFKIIGDVYKMIDCDEYFFKVGKEYEI